MSNQDFATAVPPSSQPVQPHHDEKSEAGVAWQPPRLPMAVPAQPMMLAPGYLQASLRQPAMVPRLAAAPLAPIALAPRLSSQMIGAPVHHTAVVKAPTASIALLSATADPSRVIGNVAMTSSTAMVVTPSALQPHTLQAPGYAAAAGGSILHAQPLPQQVAMASLIRGAMPASVLPSIQTRPHQATHQLASNIGQAYLSHVPRGAIAASALASPKSVAMTTAVLRPCAVGGGVVVTSSAPLPPQPRPMLPISRGTASPVITLHAAQAALPDAQRLVLGQQQQRGAPPAAMQISLQPASRLADHAVAPRAVLSHVVAPKLPPPSPSQPLLHSSLAYHAAAAAAAGGQKVLVSSAVPAPAAAPLTAAGSVTAAVATIGQPKLGRPGVAFNVAAPIGALAPPHKVITAHPATHMQPAANIVQSQPFGLGHTFTHQQKVVMTQSSTPQPLQVTLSGATTSKSGAVSALNLTQPLARMPPKIAGITLPTTLTPASPVVTVTKAAVSQVLGAVSLSAPPALVTATTTVAAAAIPIAKVTPQRQPVGDALPQAVAVQVTSGVVAPQQTSQAVYLSHPVSTPLRLPTASAAGAADIRASAVQRPATVQRSAFTPHLPYTIPPEFYRASIVNYPSLVYPPVAPPAGQPHPFAALAPAATIRTNIVPGQNPNLATALQVAAHAVSAGVGVVAASAVRVTQNPMMVTVNPRHPSLALRAHYSPNPLGSRSAGDLSVAVPVSLTHAAAAAVCQTTSSHVLPQSQSPAPPPPNSVNPTASPRPSILRKRTNDGVTVVKKNLMGTSSPRDSNSPLRSSSLPPATPPKSSVPCDASRDNSQSSTDTASSVESTPLSVPSSEVKVKQETIDATENVPPSVNTPFSMLTAVLPKLEEASPRKKPRKQLLNANEELKDENSTDEDEFSAKVKQEPEAVPEDIKTEELTEYVDEEGIRWVKEKRRSSRLLLDYYDCTWKAKLNHFVKPTDVKPKEERQPTVNELANERKVFQTASGWKLYHLAAQLEELVELETGVGKAMREIQESIAPTHIAKHTLEDDIGMVHELTQGNIQRSQLVADQLVEAKTSMLNVLSHKQRALEVINKHHSKRPVKKKERN